MPWFVGRRVVEPALEELVPFIDWTFFFSAWELKGRFPAILDHPDVRRGRARAVRPRAGAARPHRQGEAPHARAASTASGRPTPIGDDIVVYKDDARRDGAGAVPHAAAAGADRRRAAEPIAGRLRRAEGVDGARLHRRVRGDRRHRRRRARARSTRRSTTTTTRSSSRRWPIGWPRRSPSTCTRRRARTGATARTSSCRTRS